MSTVRLIAAAVVILAGPASAESPVTIELSSFAYAPKTISLAAGKPVTLVFVNRSGSAHDFTAKKFFAGAKFVNGSAPGGEIELKGGQSRTITLVPAAGSYNVHCGHFMHKQFGMHSKIIVR